MFLYPVINNHIIYHSKALFLAMSVFNTVNDTLYHIDILN